MTEKTLTTENIKPALDALRGELAPWPAVAMKQDRLNDTQKSAVNSGITSGLVAQIIANTAAIRALESAITGTGLRPLIVASLPAIGTQGILYIVPVTTYDPETDADVVNYSNEYIWIVAPDAPVTEGYYEQVGRTGIVINDGQLTITVNGTPVGTFTANQSGDTTAAITVPTNADYVDKTTDQSAAGVKTFSDGIVSNVTGNVTGDLTGTASRAIADEDGNSIKTSYGKLAGNQTWTGSNIYEQAIRIAKTSGDSEIEIVNKNIDIKSNTTTEMDDIRFMDKNGKITGGLRVTYNNTQVQNSLSSRSWSSDGTTYSNAAINIVSDYQNNVAYINVTSDFLPTSTNNRRLGNASYQWASVYAQTYYYNGTQWGLDKANVWTGTNDFSILSLFSNSVTYNEAPSNNIELPSIRVFGGGRYCGAFDYVWRSTGENVIRLSLASYKSDGTFGYWSCNFGVPRDFSDGGKFGTPAFYPNNNNAYDLGISTNQWKSVYAQSYYYNGTAWGLDKANVWTGDNTFSHINRKFWSVEKGVLPTTNNDRYTYFLDKNGATLGYTQISYNTAGNIVYSVWLQNSFSNGQLDPTGTDRYAMIGLSLKGDGSRFFSVYADAIPNNTGWFNLGTSTNKWKTLNGINPGALSLPDFTSETGISLSAGANTYTPVFSGWLSISTTGDISVVCGNFCHKATDMISVPVIAGKTYTVTMPASATGYFYSCLGNV